MSENVSAIITLVLMIAILIVGIGSIIYNAMDLDFNGGKCEVCGENVIPVAHAYTTEYYCPSCGRYNTGV